MERNQEREVAAMGQGARTSEEEASWTLQTTIKPLSFIRGKGGAMGVGSRSMVYLHLHYIDHFECPCVESS